MHTSHNPFGGWSNAGNGHSLPAPSIFGALPYPTSPPSSTLITFHLTSFNPTVLNCTVVGPQSQPYFTIATDSSMPGYTVVRNSEGKSVALVEWQSHPMIEVRGILSKQSISRWLRLSSDRSSRYMDVRGIRYTWAPQGEFINLFTSGPSPPVFLARISRGQGTVRLDMTTQATQLGLLEVSIVAALLLQCGRNID